MNKPRSRRKTFKWKNEHEELKRTFCSAPILALLNFGNNASPFVLGTNANDVALVVYFPKEGGNHVSVDTSTKLSKK